MPSLLIVCFIRIIYKILNDLLSIEVSKRKEKQKRGVRGFNWREHARNKAITTVEWFNVFLILILGYHMKLVKKEEEGWSADKHPEPFPKLSSEEEGSSSSELATRHLAFEKNYPKNIFIPLIEHLGEMGLQEEYEDCVGTR